MRVTKLLFLLDCDVRQGAGAERFVLNLGRFAAENGFEVTVAGSGYADRLRLSDREIISAIDSLPEELFSSRRHNFDFLLRSFPGRLFKFFVQQPLTDRASERSVRALAEVLAKEHDVVYVVSNSLARFVRNANRPIIGSPHGALIHAAERALARAGLIYRDVTAFHVFDDTMSTALHGRRAAIVSPPGIDTHAFAPGGVPKTGPRRFLYVGRMIATKGLPELLSAWDGFKANGRATLTLVGTGDLDGSVREWVARHPETNFFPSISARQLEAVYQQSDCLVVPSKIDFFPVTVLEGLSAGLWCIVSTALKPVFAKLKQTGMIEFVPPDPKALSAAMESWITQPRPLDESGAAAHAFISANYDTRVTARAFYLGARDLVESTGAGPPECVA